MVVSTKCYQCACDACVRVPLQNDTLVLECIYNTSTRNSVTLVRNKIKPIVCILILINVIFQGGETTRQEMCLTFPIYYPRIEGRALDLCVSLPSGSGEDSIRPFVQKYGPYVSITIIMIICAEYVLTIIGVTCSLYILSAQ